MSLAPILDSIRSKTKDPGFWLRVTGATFMTLLTFYVLFLFIDPSDVIDILSQVSLAAVLLGFVFYLGSTLFRAARFNVVHPKVSTPAFFSIASIHTLLTNLLPARTGELAFPVLLKRVDGSSFFSSLAMLLVVRIFDLVAVFALFFIALVLTFPQLDARLHLPMFIVSLVFIAGLAVILCVLVFGKRVIALAQRMLFFDGLKNSKTTIWIISKLELVLDGFLVIKKMHALWRILLFSLLIWICNYATVFVIVRAMGLDLSVWLLTLGLTFSVLFLSLPIHGIGFFGTLEGAWTLIFLGLGATKEVSFATGFGFHIFNIAYLLVLGLLGTAHLIFLGGPRKNADQKLYKKSASSSRRTKGFA